MSTTTKTTKREPEYDRDGRHGALWAEMNHVSEMLRDFQYRTSHFDPRLVAEIEHLVRIQGDIGNVEAPSIKQLEKAKCLWLGMPPEDRAKVMNGWAGWGDSWMMRRDVANMGNQKLLAYVDVGNDAEGEPRFWFEINLEDDTRAVHVCIKHGTDKATAA